MFNRNCSVLLVDDEAFSRMLIGECIRKIPNIKLAESLQNGFDAKRYLLEHPVDIIITDIRMPLMDGLELANFVKKFCPQCMVVIISAYGEFDYAQKAIQYGVTDYLLKPVQLEQIIEVVNRNADRIEEHRNQIILQQYDLDREIEDRICSLFLDNTIFEGWKKKIKERLGRKNILLRLNIKDKANGRSGENSVVLKKVLQYILPGWQVLRIRYELREYEYLVTLSDDQNHRSLENIEEYLNYVLNQEIEVSILRNIKSPEELEHFYNCMKKEHKTKEIQAALQYMEDHMQEDLSRDEVANYVYLSPSYFSRLFKSEVGVGFGDYLLDIRIRRAKKLLAENKKVCEIAAAVGFRDVKYFSVVFEKFTNYLPSEYRRALLGGAILEEKDS